MVANVTEDLGFDATLDGIDDALVCLVRHDQVQIVDVHSLSLADAVRLLIMERTASVKTRRPFIWMNPS